MKERSERAPRQVKYLKADLHYSLLSCLAAVLFLLFGGLVVVFLPVGDKRRTLAVRLYKAETHTHFCKAYRTLLMCDPLRLTANAPA